MTENNDQAMELQAILQDGQQINDASTVAASSQQASESTVVRIEQVDEGNSYCLW